MPSCSRIVRRCGDVDASSSGGAGGALIRACAPARSPPTATASPTPRSSGSTRGSRRPPARRARSGRARRSPTRASSLNRSPWPSWNSVVSSSSQSIRCSPRCGRCSVSDQPSSVAQSIDSVELRRKTSSPPGRSSRAASGIHRYGSHQIDAPYSESTTSNEASGSGTVLGVRLEERELDARSRAASARAVSSCAGVTSTPTGRAPRRASHAEKYAVPQPSSITSLPSTSGSAFSSDSGR